MTTAVALAPQPTPRVIAPELRLSQTAAGSVLQAVRRAGTVTRDKLVRDTGLSAATVNRQVTALLDSDMLRERADLVTPGAIGRPRVPVEVLHEPYLTLGIHLGARVTSIVANDLRGHTLGVVEVRTPRSDAVTALSAIAAAARRHLGRWPGRRVLWVGVALGGRVDTRTGTVDHPPLGWNDAPVAAVLSTQLSLPVSVAAHVEAMAAAELLLARNNFRDDEAGSSLYFYCRETVGAALTIDGKVHTPAAGAGTISHLPTGSDTRCDCGRTGCLEATVRDSSVVAAALRDGLIDETAAQSGVAAVRHAADSGSIAARRLLNERAEILGHAAGLLRDLLNPDRLILGGQAFTDYPNGNHHVMRAFTESTSLPPMTVHVSGFGVRVQQAAASATSLSAIYSDPLSAMRKATARRDNWR
ncbi:ROK family protein [Rhodococcus sp. D2-41]|uniref:ROK family protein n=1 Tax=Speluncibacter jeojiensis TaxID=2710754 RepID=A0A9X4M2E1_9ACTN|nr:ROK family protein [Rhodococcus sp. D2-41]MDG3009580.1 ROK family protein [Rhodococcus sp. D2-41]MDG3016783.1 ROK family protein [Corynebacteriales bacterium D3-21]